MAQDVVALDRSGRDPVIVGPPNDLIAIDHCPRPSTIVLGSSVQATRQRRSRKARSPPARAPGSSRMSRVGGASGCSWLASPGMGNWSASEPIRRSAAATRQDRTDPHGLRTDLTREAAQCHRGRVLAQHRHTRAPHRTRQPNPRIGAHCLRSPCCGRRIRALARSATHKTTRPVRGVLRRVRQRRK
jgi:hypothetical protein